MEITSSCRKKKPWKHRLKIFAPNGNYSSRWKKTNLNPKGENDQYSIRESIVRWFFDWITATYKPTFWSQNAEGWKMDNLEK